MKVGIIGGVGKMGRGLALRLAKSNEVFITSRNYEKAVQIANGLEETARNFYKERMFGSIGAASNTEAVNKSETLIVTIPAENTLAVMQDLKAFFRQDQVVISTVVSMKKSKGVFRHTSLSQANSTTSVSFSAEQKSAAEQIQEIIKPASVVSAFHTVPAAYLNSLDEVLNIDIFLAGDTEAALSLATKLICEIPNLRPLKAGPLENSRLIEAMVPLLLNVALLNNLKEPSVRVVPWIPAAYDGCA